MSARRWPGWTARSSPVSPAGPSSGNLGGAFTITEVDAGRRWVTECPVPLGKVVFDHSLEPAGAGRVRVVKRVGVQGGFGPLLRLFAPKMRREIAESLAALQRQVSSDLSGQSGGSRRRPPIR